SSQVAAAVAHLASRYSTAVCEIRPLGLFLAEPRLLTTTRDSRDNVRIGLHVDSWFGLPLSHRRTAPNRLCVNLGNETRRFLFVNLSLDKIVSLLSSRCGPIPTSFVNPTDIGRIFLSRFPDYPIVSVKIAPGEAYIAPTEYLIHDATTFEMT